MSFFSRIVLLSDKSFTNFPNGHHTAAVGVPANASTVVGISTELAVLLLLSLLLLLAVAVVAIMLLMSSLLLLFDGIAIAACVTAAACVIAVACLPSVANIVANVGPLVPDLLLSPCLHPWCCWLNAAGGNLYEQPYFTSESKTILYGCKSLM